MRKSVQTTEFYRRNLPHWRVSGKSYFVTFRLKGTIPADVIKAFKDERSKVKHEDINNRILLQRKHFKKLEQILDSNTEINYLKEPEIAETIVKAINWAEETHGWGFYSFVVMPNHVHCLLSGRQADNTLTDIMKSIKGYTARIANSIMNRKGSFWAPEYFEHWCRTPDKEESVIRYIRNNPVKAGLVKKPEDWSWIK